MPPAQNRDPFIILWSPATGFMGPSVTVPLAMAEERLGLPVHEMADAIFAASGGAVPAAAAVIPDRADPTRPAMTMRQVVNDQIANSWQVSPNAMPSGLPTGPAGTFTRLAARANSLVNTVKGLTGLGPLEDRRDEFFTARGANVPMTETLLPIAIAAHAVGPDRDRGQEDFIAVPRRPGRHPLDLTKPDGLKPTSGTATFREALLATTALSSGGAFKMDRDGQPRTYLDQGVSMSPIDMVQAMKKSLPAETPIVFVRLGVLHDDSPYPDKRLNIRNHMGAVARANEQNSIETTMKWARRELGAENVIDLSTSMHGFYDQYYGKGKLPSSMDASPATQQLWADMTTQQMEKSPEFDRFLKLVEPRAHEVAPRSRPAVGPAPR